MLIRLIALSLVCATIAACSFPKLSLPRVHKVTVQQGNVITQEMVDKLKPGMTRSQVAYILGEPVLRSTFSNNRWDYVYSVEVPGYFSNEVHLSLFFDGDNLAYFTGDLAPTAQASQDATMETSTSEG